MFIIIFFSDVVLPKVHDHVIWQGKTFNCDDHHTVDNSGQYCGCVFLACTGSQDCSPVDGMAHCAIKKNDYNYLDMSSEDCGCHYHE